MPTTSASAAADPEHLETRAPSARLTAALGDAFESLGLDRTHGLVQVSNRPDLCQYQCNGAMAAAKAAKKPPRAIAEALVAALDGALKAELATLEIAGPGFINLSFADEAVARMGRDIAADLRLGLLAPSRPRTVVLDFGGPNVAKPMHVGHLRSAIIGDCLQRLFRFVGDRTVSDVHLGDWGLPMGMLIAELARTRPELPYFAEGSEGPFPAEAPVTLEDLEVLYPRAAAAAKADPVQLDAARAATAALQAGHPGYRALWQHFIEVSLAALRREFGALGVTFDLWKGEADADPLIPEIVADLRGRGLAVESDGALVVAVAEESDQAEMPPLILLKSDGSVMYSTTDVATIVERVRVQDPDLILYVVDQRQALHFEQVFRTVRKAGLAGRARLEHIGFGTVNGPDGKPFKTRAGGVMRLHDLIAMATETARRRLDEAGLAADADEAEKQAIAKDVGLAAIKFADLSNHRLSNYVFDLERFTTFEGKTGPYLQYQAVRIKSLLRKAEAEGIVLPPADAPLTVRSEAERALVLTLAEWPERVAEAYAKRAPNLLCEQAFALAQGFSRFYAAHHVLSEPDADLRAARLALARATLRALETLLSLVGITVPDRM